MSRFLPAERREASSGGAFPLWRTASALTQTDDTEQRSSLTRMASPDVVQTKGLRLALCSAR